MPASVLLVHDDIAAIAAARRVLVAEGLDVTLATSSSDAFVSYQQRPFQLVVLAPAVDSGRGASVYDEIRSLPSGARVRFILLGSEIAEARGALVVDLPLQAGPFRIAVREALQGLGDTTLAPRRVRGPEAEHPTLDASPWGAPVEDAPLAQQLFDQGRESEVPTTEGDARPMLIMPAVTMGETEALPEPYAAITPETPTLERELRWDELNLPSEDSDEARRPLTLSDARPVTAPTQARPAPSESRILAELTAESEIVSRARALTDPTHAVKSVRPETDPNTTSLLETERQARAAAEAKLAEVERAEAQRRSELEQAESRHRAELSHAVTQLRAEQEGSETRHRAEVQQLRAEVRTEAETRAAEERAAWEQSQVEVLAQLEVARQALAESERRVHELTQTAESRAAAEAQQRAEAEARAHSTAERLSNLEQRAARAQGELEAEREARHQAEEAGQSEVGRRSLLEQELAEARGELENERRTRLVAEQHAASLDEQRLELEVRTRAALADAGVEAEHLAAAVLQHQEAESEHTEAADSRSAAEQRAHELASRRVELERATRAAQERAKAESQRVAELEAEQQQAQHDLEALRQARTEAEQLTHEASARRSTLEHELRSTRDRTAEEQARLTELHRLHAEAEAHLQVEAAARAEAEQLTQRELAQIQEAELIVREAQARFDSAQAARGEVEQQARAAQERRRQLQDEAGAAQERAQAGEARLAEFEKARLRIEGHLQTALEQRDQLAAQLQSLETRERGGAEGLVELERRQREAGEEVAAQQRSITDAEHRAQEVQAQHEATEHAISELTSQAQQGATQLAELDHARQEAELRLEAFRQSREAAELQAAELTAKHKELRHQIEQAEERAQLEAQRATELEERRQQTESQLAEAQRQREEAVSRAESGTTQVAEAERVHAEAQARLQAELSGRAEAERQAEEVASRRAAFAEALAKADPHAEPPSAPTAPEEAPSPPPPPRRVLRPLAGGRWKRAELGPLVPLPAEAALPSVSDGPGEARPPRFPPTGKLAELGAAELLARCWHERVTGRFDFDCRDGARALFFEEGRVVAAISNAPTDRLEALAQRDGLITRAHQRALRPDAERLSARQLAVRLVELRLIKGTELYALVRRQMEEVTFALFADDSADYLYAPDLAPQELRVALPVTPLAFMVEGVRRKGDFDRLNAALGGPTVRVRLLREGAPDLADLGLSARERRLVSLIDGLRTVEELIFASGLDPQAAVKLLYALRAAGAIETLASEPQEVAEGGRTELLIDLSRVTEKYHQVQQGDYFEILGVPPEATAYEVRQAFERLTREFHPARFAGVSDEALPAHLEEIGRMVAEAADVLADDLTRREYARNLSAAS